MSRVVVADVAILAAGLALSAVQVFAAGWLAGVLLGLTMIAVWVVAYLHAGRRS